MELLLALIELALEVLAETGGVVTIDFALRALAEIFGPLEPPVAPIARFLAFLGFLVLGTLFGFWSMYLFPRHFFHAVRVRGLSLVVSPVLTGLLMSFAGKVARKNAKRTTLIESFAYGFAFAFGMALIRFLSLSGFPPPNC